MIIRLWHKTTKSNALKIAKEGFKTSYRGTGARGSKTDIKGTSFGLGEYRFSNDMLAYDLGVNPSDIVTLTGTATAQLKAVMYNREPTKKSLEKRGYDGVIYPSGEVVLFNPNKTFMFDFKTKMLLKLLNKK